MSNTFKNSSILNCRLSEAPLGCSITIEHDKAQWQENIKCTVRFHGRNFLSTLFPIEMTRDGRMETNFVFQDIGEIIAIEIELLPNENVGLFIKWIDVNIPRKSYLQRFDVQRWLHPKMGDKRTRLMVMPNNLPGYVPKKIYENVQKPKREYVKYVFLIEVTQTNGDVNNSVLSIDLIGKYGQTTTHRINVKYGKIVQLNANNQSNIFELTMLDVGPLHEYIVSLENENHSGGYFISNIYIFHRDYYASEIHQWIEADQILTGSIRLLSSSNLSTFFNGIQIQSSLIIWMTSSEYVKEELTLPIELIFNCQNASPNPIQQTYRCRGHNVTVFALTTTCTMPLNSIMLGHDEKHFNNYLTKEIAILDINKGHHYYFDFENEVSETKNNMKFYSFLPKQTGPPLNTNDSKYYVITVLTSEKELSENHTIKVVLRGELGLTKMLSLHNSSWNKIPFQSKHKDKFLLFTSNIGKIIGLTLFPGSEKTKFQFDILEIFVPDTKMCIRIYGPHEIINKPLDFICQESQIVYIVQIKSGFSTLNDTADVLLTLIGDDASHESILLTCDSDTKPFLSGQLDTFYIPSKKLGKIRAVDIKCSNIANNCKWFCETIYVHDMVFNIKSNYLIYRWCGDHQESDLVDKLNIPSKSTLIQPTSTKFLTNFLLTIKTGLRSTTNFNLTPSVYIFFSGQYGSSPVIHLNDLTTRTDLFQSLEIDEFTFTIPDTGMPNIMRIWNTEELASWTCEYIDIKNINTSKTAHFPVGVDLNKNDPLVSLYIDVEADIGKINLSLPGPHRDAAYPSYDLTIGINKSTNSENLSFSIQLEGDKNHSKLIRLNRSGYNDDIIKFILYGICSLGDLKEMSIYFHQNSKEIRSLFNYMIIYDYLNDKYYATKTKSNELFSKYKLGLMKTIDPKYLDVELNRIEIEYNTEIIQKSNPLYRILYKTQSNLLTNLTLNAQLYIRLIGDKTSSFIHIENNLHFISRNINDYYYYGDEYIDGLNKIDLKLIDDDYTQWGCESIEIQDLINEDIIVFPINDIIESTRKIDRNNPKITTWKSGIKSGIIFLIRIRSGKQGASLNFRYGSVYLSLKFYGDSGVSNEIPLHVPIGQSYYFKPNQIDTFEISQMISSVGQITAIDVSHNGKKDDYFNIDWIDIKDITTNKTFHFTVDTCLDRDLGTNLKILHLTTDLSTRKSINQLESLPNYIIRIKTGIQTPLHVDEPNDSPVLSITLIDSLSDSMQIPLGRINNSVRSIFQPGQEDRFDITITPMLELKMLQMYFHGTFSWFCERIAITDQSSGLSYRFDVEEWLTEKNIDSPINIFGQREDDFGWKYFVTIKTQAVLPAQTSLRGKIFLSIYGDKSPLNDAIVGSGRFMHDLFHAGAEDTIELKSLKRLGDIHSIELRLEIAEWQSWLCDTIEINDPNANWDFVSRTMTAKTYKFPINRWLGAHAMDKRTTLRSTINQEPGYAKMPTYIIHILTGNKNINIESDIQINVYLQLFCAISNNVYGPILLDKSSNNTQPFRKGQIDEFYINDLYYCGEINKIRLWHNGGKITSWHCEWIKITNVQKNEIYEFPVEKILDEDLEEGSSNLICFSEKKDEMNEGELSTPDNIIS